MLASLVRGNIQLWDAGPEVPEFTPQAELVIEGHIQAPADLEYAVSSPRFRPKLSSASVEVTEAAAHADPRRDRRLWKEIESRCRGHKNRLVAGRYRIVVGMHVLIDIKDDREFHRQSQ